MEADSFAFPGFNLHAWITIVTVLTMFTVLLFTKLYPKLPQIITRYETQ